MRSERLHLCYMQQEEYYLFLDSERIVVFAHVNM